MEASGTEPLITNGGSAWIRVRHHNAARHLKMASCFPEMLRSISKWRVASGGCCAAPQSGKLLPEMLRGISKWRAASRRCCAATQNGELLPGDAARHLKVASCFPEMLSGISKWRVASRRCCAASQSGELLPGNAAQHLKMASCFPKMLHSIPDFRLSTFRFRALYQVWGSRQMLLFCRRKKLSSASY